MANRVFKHTLQVEPRQMIQMGINDQVLSCGVQNEFPVIWFLTNQDRGKIVPRFFRVVTTGEEFESDLCLFVGSVTLKGWFVVHIFEQIEGLGDPVSDRFADDYVAIAKELATA